MDKSFRILVPVDFSEEMKSVYDFVSRYFLNGDAQITLLHIQHLPVIPGDSFMQYLDMKEFYDKHREGIKSNMESLVGSSAFAGKQVTTDVIESLDMGIGEAIAAYARDKQFDLVIMIAKERKGLDRVVVGTELFRTLRSCRVPVLVLRSDHPIKGMHRLGMAMDFSELSLAGFRKLSVIAEFLGAEIIGFVVNTADAFITDREFSMMRADFIGQAGISSIPEILTYNDYTLEEGVTHFAEDQRVDLVALSSHARKGLTRFLAGSAAEEIIKGSTVPFIFLPQPQ